MRHMYMSNLVFVLVNYFPLISSLCSDSFCVQFDLILMYISNVCMVTAPHVIYLLIDSF
jgi:hypothetical protein